MFFLWVAEMFAEILVISFLVSILSLIVFRPLAFNVGLVDIPSERKMHRGHIPLIGGIAIYLSFMFSVVALPEISPQVECFFYR